jgi:hypothetical protein
MEYDKINEYVESIFNIFKIVKAKAQQNDDKKMKMISLLIYKYAIKMAKDHNVKIKNTLEIDSIDLIPLFEYISHNHIEFYDFSKIKIAFDWFLGNNHLHQILYNPCTGGCYDGLEQYEVNLNQGAESTLSYLMARIAADKYLHKEAVQKKLNNLVLTHY